MAKGACFSIRTTNADILQEKHPKKQAIEIIKAINVIFFSPFFSIKQNLGLHKQKEKSIQKIIIKIAIEK